MADPERAPTASEAPLVHVYTQIQLQKMPKLTKQAFFPCNLHSAVRSAMVCTAAATPGAAQSGSGSSRLLGGLWDTSASLTKHCSPSSARLCQKETPLQNAATAWARSSNRGSPSWCQALPALPLSRAQVPQISSWHLPGGWMGGGSAAPAFPAEEHPHEGDGRWLCGLARAARGHGSVPGSASPSCEMKAETILQEIK